MMEETNAQLLYQNLHLRRQNQALHNKEKKKNEQSLLFNGEGKVLSSDAFTEKLRELQEARQAAAEKRTRNADTRKAKKDALAAIEEEWVKIKAAHEVPIMTWQLECQRLASEGMAKRTWPKKPVRPLKPKLPPNLHSVDGDAGEENDEDFDEDDQID